MKWTHLTVVLAALVCFGVAPHQYADDADAAITSVRFQATVWQVTLTSTQALSLDAQRLAKSGKTAAEMFTRLRAAGPVRVLHHIDERPAPDERRAFGTRSNIPVVNSITNPNRDTLTISYLGRSVGLTLNLAWSEVKPGVLSIRLHGTLSAPVDKAIQFENLPAGFDVQAMRNIDVHTCDLAYFGDVALDDPQVIVRVLADPREQDVVYAYVVRLALSDPGR